MNKSSFLNGLINEKEKNIAEYLVGWDNLNILFKSIGKVGDFISSFWNTEAEMKESEKQSYIDDVNAFLKGEENKTKLSLHVVLYERFIDIFDIEHGIISSQKELDDYCIELEEKAVLFQRELSKEEDKMKNFDGKNFVDLRKYFLEIMVDQFKDLDNEKQKKILEEMVNKLNSLSSDELNEFKDKMNINEITNESVQKILLGSGMYTMFAGTVGLVGFPAYIFLTSFIGGI